MSDLLVVPGVDAPLVVPSAPDPVLVPEGLGAPGSKGDPGGNVMAIGLFTAAGGLTIPTGTDLVRTSGYSTAGRGSADYAYDATVDSTFVSNFPGGGFVSANGRGFRLIGGAARVTPFDFGLSNGTNPKKTGETVVDCANALDEMWGYVKDQHINHGVALTMDLSGVIGGGHSRQWVLDPVANASFWDTPVFRIIPGRMVAMADMESQVKIAGKSINVTGEWQLYGAVFDQMQTGYAGSYSKYGMIVEDAGGSRIGDVRCEGARRYMVRCSNASSTNNIPLSFGQLIGARLGNWHSAALGMTGTYTGTWTNTGSDGDSYAQRHRMALTCATGRNPTDLEIGDALRFNGTSIGIIQNVVGVAGQVATVDIYPWQPTQSGGTWESLHGGGFDADGVNLACCSVEKIEALVGGTALRVSAEFCPKIGVLLSESCSVGVQFGKNTTGGLEGLRGLRVDEYHIENTTNCVLDFAASADCHLGTISAISGTARGTWDTALRLEPARYSGGYQAAVRRSLSGISALVDGQLVGGQETRPIEYSLDGSAINVGNSPLYSYDYGFFANSLTANLIAEYTLAEKFNRRNFRIGPIRGSGTNGAPSATITLQIGGGQSGTVTVEGGATLDLTATGGALIIEGTLALPPGGGDNADWKINAWECGPTVPTSGGGSSSGGIGTLPVDPLTKSAVCYVEPARSATYQDTGTTTVAGAGDPVGDLRDLSGNGHHATQGTSGKRMVLRKPGSLAYVEADGSDDWLLTNSFSQSQPFTFVASVLSTNASGDLASIMFAGSSFAALQVHDAGGWRAYAGNDVHGGVRDTTVRRIIAIVNGASSELWVNGELAFSGDFGSNGITGGLYFGVANSESSQFFKGGIFAAGVLAGVLDDVPGVDAWLQALGE